jgi:cytoskeletal protein CcmA (bactofilin family)
MWKRDDAVKPTTPGSAAPGGSPAVGPPPVAEAASTRTATATNDPTRGTEKTTVNIGKSVVIKGELNGSEDLTIEGQVEGKIELRQNVLTIGPNGRIKAQVFAKSVVILGEVTGNVTASEKVDIRDNGSVDGDIAAPRVAIAEGAHFRGSIDMQRAAGKPGEQKPGEQKTDQKPAEAKQAAQAAGAQPGAAPAPAGATR